MCTHARIIGLPCKPISGQFAILFSLHNSPCLISIHDYYIALVFISECSQDHSGKRKSAFSFNAASKQLIGATAVAPVVDWNREMLHCRLYRHLVQCFYPSVTVMNFAMTLVTVALTSMNCKFFNFYKIVGNRLVTID